MASSAGSTTNPGGSEPILDDDQMAIYDWGIENRLDQYYTNNPHHHGHPHHGQHQQDQGYVPNGGMYAQGYQPQQHQPPPRLPQHFHYGGSGTPVPGTTTGTKVEAVEMLTPTSQQPQQQRQQEQQPYEQPQPPYQPGAASAGRRRPVLPPVDMDANELMKVERKRARNRVAASKCRLRKLEKIAVLDGQATRLRNENEELVALAEKLRAQIYSLKQEIRWHVNNGCKVFSAKEAAGNSNSSSASPDSTTSPNVVAMASPQQPQQQQQQQQQQLPRQTQIHHIS